MFNIINTSRFFLQYQLNKTFPVETSRYGDRQLKYEITVYRPAGESSLLKRKRKVILAFHGMTMLGGEDPKFTGACRSLSGCGFTVIAPQIDSMQKLDIDLSDIKAIVETINNITQNRELCPEGKLSIFAASFAGGISLIVSSDEKISEKISSICLIGSFSSIENSIGYLLSTQESDDYGRLIILKNFLHYSIDVPDNVYRVFDIALADNFYKKENPELPDFLRELSLKDYDIAARLLNDPYYRQFHWDRIRKNEAFNNMAEQLSIENCLRKIKASVLVIHGIYDNVIPPEESLYLFRELKKIKVKTKLILTPLMSHSDVKINLGILPSVFDLLNGMSFFFSAAR